MLPSSATPVTVTSSPALVALCGLSAEELRDQWLDLLPRGPIWPRDPATTLARFWLAIADGELVLRGRDCDLLQESFPCGSTELLPDWERVVGIPDECIQSVSGMTIAQRRQYVCARLAATPGGQSRAFFVALAAAYGFTISITEHWPWAMGCAPLCDDTTVGNPGSWWTVQCSQLPISYITVGCWHLCDPLFTAEGADLLECIIRRAAPAHTVVNFSYRLQPAIWNKGRWNLDAWTPLAEELG